MSDNTIKRLSPLKLPLLTKKEVSGQAKSEPTGPKDIPWSPTALTVEVGKSFKPEVGSLDVPKEQMPKSEVEPKEAGNVDPADYKSRGYDRGHLSANHSDMYGHIADMSEPTVSLQDRIDGALERSKTPDSVLREKYLEYILT